MTKKCDDKTCYHCKVEVQTKNKQFCPECFEIYNELFDEFQEFYENESDYKIRITRMKHFKASTRSYIRNYLNSEAEGIPIYLYMNLHGLVEEYVERIDRINYDSPFDSFLGFGESKTYRWHNNVLDNNLVFQTDGHGGINLVRNNSLGRKLQDVNQNQNYQKFTKQGWKK